VTYGFLTKAHPDFIFSVWCEELGFVGAVAVVILFMVLVWRGYRIAMRAPDKFMSLTAFGITTHIGLQAFLNMFVATDLIANTGIPLPFFTYGGSSMVILMGEIGILLGISRRSYRKKADIEREELMRKAKMQL
jgi:cell division protein FtsW